ncbi:ParB family chromosome partitioning protein [Clostridium moniliforme]|uniref:ParB family chromosome partitioning protein n=1 Tax=Clostridium moniliforme TaxID=39489 RepID=A0ABS4F3J5_9CLOT|nr:ParB/RepB/Spo0J family partition protein [Clostridium moniliforme]MBP1890802.1 ParB family chromosome partitioning protein [Clostridium moniliforme]
MSKKFGLGKGLGALIPDEVETKEKSSSTTLIPLNSIVNNSDQPRKFFDSDNIAELAESIKNHGIIQPLILKKDGNKYVIIAGERRWRAAKMLSLKEVPAIIMELSDKEILEISLIENIQRQDLNPIEEALAYRKLIDDFNLTQQELSKRIGKSRVAITNTMRLINLDERVQQYLIESVISEGHGRALLGVEDKDLQYDLAQKIIDEKLSVRELERLIKLLFKEKDNDNKKKNEEINPYVKDVQNRLQDYFGTKVNINSKNKKGKIEIEYYSEDDLNRILELINI